MLNLKRHNLNNVVNDVHNAYELSGMDASFGKEAKKFIYLNCQD
jgi:hypothetical protein